MIRAFSAAGFIMDSPPLNQHRIPVQRYCANLRRIPCGRLQADPYKSRPMGHYDFHHFLRGWRRDRFGGFAAKLDGIFRAGGNAKTAAQAAGPINRRDFCVIVRFHGGHLAPSLAYAASRTQFGIHMGEGIRGPMTHRIRHHLMHS